jgi:MinD-like ATPase involved in chromosome partitioning or flagellar assembly
MAERPGDDAVDMTALPPSGDLAAALPDSLTIAIDLPADPPPDAPDDELAVAIDTVVVDPGELAPVTTTSIRVPSLLTLPEIEPAPETDPVPPLPARPIPKRRRLPGRPIPPTEDDRASDGLESDAVEAPETGASDAPGTGAPDVLEPSASGADEASEVAVGRKPKRAPKPPREPRPARAPKPRRDRGPEPEGALQVALYRSTFRLVNPGDSLRVRQRKALDARIAALPADGTGFVPVLSRKGGVGTTTITALLGMALADVRDDRVLAIDAHPDRGTLAARVSPGGRTSVRDVVTHAGGIHSVNDFAAYVARDETRLDIIASEAGPTLGLGFDQGDLGVLAGIAERFYGMALTDAGGATTHSVLRALLARANGLVVVTGGSLDEAELASETLTWLATKGYDELVRDAVVAINAATLGTDVRALESIRAHFAARVRDVVIMPYDPALAAGAVIEYDLLDVHTREAARDLAAAVVDGLAPEPEAPADPEDSTDR